MELHHDPEEQRFYTELDHGDAEVNYAPAGADRLDLQRTWVPPADRGAGIGAELVRGVLDWARQHEKRVTPTCPFVGWVIEQNPEYEDLVAPRS